MSKKDRNVEKEPDDDSKAIDPEKVAAFRDELDTVLQSPDEVVNIDDEDSEEVTDSEPKLGPAELDYSEPMPEETLVKSDKPRKYDPEDQDVPEYDLSDAEDDEPKARVEDDENDGPVVEEKEMTILQFFKHTSYSRKVKQMMYAKFGDKSTNSEQVWVETVASLIEYLNKPIE